MHSNSRPAPRGAFLCFQRIKKPSPVGEGGSRRLTDKESFSFFSNTSSTANTVPLPPGGRLLCAVLLRIVGAGFCPIVCGRPRAMLASDASVGKAEKLESEMIEKYYDW